MAILSRPSFMTRRLTTNEFSISTLGEHDTSGHSPHYKESIKKDTPTATYWQLSNILTTERYTADFCSKLSTMTQHPSKAIEPNGEQPRVLDPFISPTFYSYDHEFVSGRKRFCCKILLIAPTKSHSQSHRPQYDNFPVTNITTFATVTALWDSALSQTDTNWSVSALYFSLSHYNIYLGAVGGVAE